MEVIKFVFLGIILLISALIGINISKKYSNRLKELIEMQRALNIFEEKIKFTYETIPEVFKELSKKCNKNVGEIFEKASENMKLMSAGEAWENALKESNTNFSSDDIETLKGLAKMLGKTDLDGQVNEIRLTEKFLDTKIKEAEIEKNKNEKLYKTLGLTIGLTIVVVLV